MTILRDLLRGLNAAQRVAAEHRDGPILVLAGAGSGKTRVLTSRIAHLIDAHGVPAERILAVTFTNKAAGEMKGRIGDLLERDPAGLWIGTFHSISARLLRREAERLGFSRQFTIYDQDDQLAVIRRVMDERNHPVKLFPPKLVQNLISGAKNRMQTAQDLERSAPHDPAIRVAADVYVGLQRALHVANAMDFDDLMLHPLALFRGHPDVLMRWQRRFDYILVDEFQDTNKAQYELIRLLGAGHRNVFAVGDDDQSVYGWRGADIGNMKALQVDFGDSRLVKLEENYRSTRPILDAANAVIARNTGRLGKTLHTRRPGGDSIIVLAAADERDEAEWVARELQRRSGEGAAYTECAVLYRTNAQSRALEEAFRRAGVPYRIVGAISFYDRREVKDLLAYLRLVANPADDQAFLRAIAVPRRGVGDASLAILGEQARQWNVPLLEAASRAGGIAGLRPNLRAAFTTFADLIASVVASHRRGDAGRGDGGDGAGARLRECAARRGPGGGRSMGERAGTHRWRSRVVRGGERGAGARHATPALSCRGHIAVCRRQQQRLRGRRHDDDDAYGQGTRVACGGDDRRRRRTLPDGARDGEPRGSRGGASTVLRRHHPCP